MSPFSARALDEDDDEGNCGSATDIERRAATAEVDEAMLAFRAGASAAALVRAALEPRSEVRPCVHVLMRHAFFAEAEEGGADSAAAAGRYFAALEARQVEPPPLPAPKAASAGADVPPPSRFGGATFLSRAEEHFEARRRAGLLSGSSGVEDTNDVARDFSDAALAGAGEAAIEIE